MELWIRSQDKEKLVQVDCLCIEINEYDKKNYDIVQGCIILGTYKTKERALEVLDEIHQRLIDLQTVEIEPKFCEVCKRNLDIVYEMPKE